MKEYIMLSDLLLMFWRTVTAIASQAQVSIVGEFKEKNFKAAAMQTWLKNLFDDREKGDLSREQCLQLHHEQLIMEQLGMPSESTDSFSRCTLSRVSQMLFNFNGENNIDGTQTKSQFSKEELKELFYCYYLMSASHGADLFLNAAFGMMLQVRITSPNDAVLYNGDPVHVLELVDVQIARGAVENSDYCTSTCAFKVNKDEHTEDCKCRGVSWLLLTFKAPNGKRRQVHLDVAACAYTNANFYGTHHPVPCCIGFLPHVESSVRKQFDQQGWPMAKLVDLPRKSGQLCYVINQFDCLLPVRNHVASVAKIAKNFTELTDEHRNIVRLWHQLSHALQMDRQDEAMKYFTMLLPLATVEQANFYAAQFMHFVDARTEAIMLQFFSSNLAAYNFIFQKLSGVEIK